jgi:ABC-type branched-subunit amino acid transport system ATPase component
LVLDEDAAGVAAELAAKAETLVTEAAKAAKTKPMIETFMSFS